MFCESGECWRESRCIDGGSGVIELPDTRQLDNYDCGRAALRCVARYYRVRPLRVDSTPVDGTDPRTMEAALRSAGFLVQSGEMAVADLRHHARMKRPVICATTRDGVGHYVVVSGVARGVVHYQCPADGPCKLAEADFVARWVDRDRFGAVWLRFGVVPVPACE